MSVQEIPKAMAQFVTKSGFRYKESPQVSSLTELNAFFRNLDKRYGSPYITEPKKKNGEYALRLILKYLAENKRSTCEEIAEYEYDRHLSSKRKLKSITDDIRKFVNHNLIFSQLVVLDEPKKKYNKQVKTYSLSPVGILYCLYLFGNFRVTDDFGVSGYDFSSMESNFFRNISKEYSNVLPKVFGRFEKFEKLFGKEFLSLILHPFIEIYRSQFEGIPRPEFLLKNYVLGTYEFLHSSGIEGVQKLIAEQISLIFYIHLQDAIRYHLMDKDSEFEKMSKMSPEEANKYFKEYNLRATDRYLKSLKQAKRIWIKFMDEDKKLKKWYNNFLNEVMIFKKIEQDVISKHQKKVFRI